MASPEQLLTNYLRTASTATPEGMVRALRTGYLLVPLESIERKDGRIYEEAPDGDAPGVVPGDGAGGG